MKSTDDLKHEIICASDIVDFLDKNRDELQFGGLPERLKEWLEVKACKKSDVIRRSGLNRVYVYQIFSGLKRPSRDKLIAIAFGFSMTLEESNRLLRQAGYAELYPRDIRDAIIIKSIDQRVSIIDCNELLYDHQIEVLE